MDQRHFAVLVIGAGASGLGAAIRLGQAGVTDLAVLEKAADLGGTWRDNTYPGCACDVPSALYSFSFAPNPDWGHAYGRQPEIQAYLEQTARDFGVLERIHFETEALGAAWDDAAQCWVVETSAGTY